MDGKLFKEKTIAMLPYLKKSFKLFILLAWLTAPATLLAQNLSGYNWYFGNSKNAIRFNRSGGSASLVTNKGIPFGTGGSAVASDPTNGNLLFYTDGTQVFDASNLVMPNGTGLQGDPSQNQPVAVCRIPGKKNQYYIFHRDVGGTVFVSTVDMTQFGNAIFPAPALGDVATKNNASLSLTTQSEAMIIVPHKNLQDFWLITHDNLNPNYTVTLVTTGGTFTSTTFSGLGLINKAANFSYHAASGKIAVSPQEITRDVEIIQFDNSTGAVSFLQTIPNTGVSTATTGQAIYDTEWSIKGNFLYISRFGDTGIQSDVLQYDFLNPTTTLASVLQPNTTVQSYGLQIAPDSAIYHLYKDAGGFFRVGKMTRTDTLATAVNYTPNAFVSNPDFLGQQFPLFAPKDTTKLTLSFTEDGTCANSPTSFYPTVIPTADSLVWDFGDSAGADDWSPVHTYTAAGTYNVKVTAYLDGDTTSAKGSVIITKFDLKVKLPQDTTACSCSLPDPRAPKPFPSCSSRFTITANVSGGTPTSTQWFGPGGLLTGETSSTFQPDSAGFYYVVVTDASGCSAYAGVNIKEYHISDQRANIWYFGQNAGIDFNPVFRLINPTAAQPIDGPLNTPAGCADICDRNGQIIFSTDGLNIFNRLGTDITPISSPPNPPGLGGDPKSAESSLIVPVPGDETLYYIFTTQAMDDGTFELRYSLFDLKLNNGLGGLDSYNTLLFTKSTERICSDGNWLVAHEFGNNSFRAYRVTSNGIENPVITSIGSDHSSLINGEGYMVFGSKSRIAVALASGGSNVVEMFDFNTNTGVLTNFQSTDLNNSSGQVYGVCFSSGGNKLFATVRDGSSSKLYEILIDSLGVPKLNGTLVDPSNPVTFELGAIQIGPDGTIYVAENGQQSLGTITPREDSVKSSFNAKGFDLQGRTSNLGLPNFIQVISDPQQGPGIAADGFCLGSPTNFTGTPTDPIDKFLWFFGDGGSDTNGQTTHQYAAVGTYNVTLLLIGCQDTTKVTKQVTIVAPPAKPDFFHVGTPVDSMTLCHGPIRLEATTATDPNLSNLTFAWSTQDTTRTILVAKKGTYAVTITNVQGCTSNGSIPIGDPRPLVELGPDLTVCQNTPLAPLDAQNPGDTFAWKINGAASGTAQTEPVDSSTPGVFLYAVTIIDPVTTCFAKDSVTFTINQSPVISTITTTPATCNTANGQITFDITAPAGTLFSYFILGNSTVSPGTDQLLGTVNTGPTLLAGTYGITVSDQVTGCGTAATASIDNPDFTVGGSTPAVCDPIDIAGTVSPAQASFTYRVIDAATTAVLQSAAGAGGTFTTAALPSGLNGNNYIVEVTSTTGPSTGCVASSPPILVKQGPTVAFLTPAFVLDICNTKSITTQAPTATTFTWSTTPSGGIASSSGATAILNIGTYSVKVVAAASGSCDGKDSVNVTVDNVAPDFTQSNACSDQVILSATPAAGPYTYRWYENGTLIVGGQQLPIGITDNGASFRVDIVSALSGCVFPSTPKAVQVTGTVTVDVSSSPACQGSPFTITATSNQASAVFSWMYNGTVISGASSSTLQDTRGGKYTSTATVGVCSDSKNLTVVVAPVTPGQLHDEAFICDEAPAASDDSHIMLDPGSGFATYNWFLDGTSLAVTTPTITADKVGDYSVFLENSFGCASTDHTLVRKRCDPKIVGPSAFRPDGLNTSFFLYTFFIDDTDFQVFIFNRWGEMVYQSNDREFKWNGGFNNSSGAPLPPGTYAYVVKYKSKYNPEKGIQEKHGGVVLLR